MSRSGRECQPTYRCSLLISLLSWSGASLVNGQAHEKKVTVEAVWQCMPAWLPYASALFIIHFMKASDPLLTPWLASSDNPFWKSEKSICNAAFCVYHIVVVVVDRVNKMCGVVWFDLICFVFPGKEVLFFQRAQSITVNNHSYFLLKVSFC